MSSSVKQGRFEQLHHKEWQQLEDAIDAKTLVSIEDLGHRYRRVCHHLAQAKSRSYTPPLVDRLNRLVMALHHTLYRYNSRLQYQWWRFLVQEFPQALYDNRRFIALSAALFLLPGLGMFLATLLDESMIYTLMDPTEVLSFEAMYKISNGSIGRMRGSDTDIAMFGYYIKNNIGISFQAFASGILFGVGTLFVMIFNGVYIGGVAGHLTRLGYDDTFYPFVVGHGSFELTAIVFSGAAGLKIGFALLVPGNHRRLTALRLAAKDAIKIIYGTTLMLLIAAFIEAFWSSNSNIPPAIKYAVGFSLWLFVALWCTLAAKRSAARRLTGKGQP